MSEPFTPHEYAPSGNCDKIRLTAEHLDVRLVRRGYDIPATYPNIMRWLARVAARPGHVVIEA